VRLVAEVEQQVIYIYLLMFTLMNLFKRSDENLFFEFPISLADAALGTTIEIPTIDGGKQK
jgi:molecular chaperone DnaJ